MKLFPTLLLGLGLAGAALPAAQTTPPPALPKVVLVGDSIRLGYAPGVARLLQGKATLVSAPENGGDSANVLKHLEEWIVREQPDIVHFNCGLHDLKLLRATGRHQVDLADYESNLRQLVTRLQRETRATLIFANTTPIIDDRHARRGADFDRHEADVKRYNAGALQVMQAAGIPVDDLHAMITQAGAERVMAADGTHYTSAGYERLAEAVADCVQRHIIVRRYARPAAAASVSGPEVARRYRADEAARDAAVPPAYKRLPIGKFPLPADAAAWQRQRPGVLRTVVQSLGDFAPRPAPAASRVVSRELRPGYTLDRVALDNGEGQEISALLLVPENRAPGGPAILWLHSSTPDKNQLITPNSNGGPDSLGDVFIRAGYVVLAPDACWYGDRAEDTPGGRPEAYDRENRSSYELSQKSLHKLDLWLGRTLWGRFVRDDQIALDYLCSLPAVDPGRIGVTGMSMGSTRAWWLAAVDERVAATVGVACLTRYQNLIEHGNLRAHGLYYFTYGLLRHFDTEGVLALIAPRPYLALTGDLDYGSPVDGIRVIEEKVRKVYRTVGAPERFRNVIYPDVGHTYTPEMRAEMLAWFERWLKPTR